MSETKLEMAERHVREGAQRIARQKAVIETFAKDGYNEMLPVAHELLNELESGQEMSEKHLAHCQAEGTLVPRFP